MAEVALSDFEAEFDRQEQQPAKPGRSLDTALPASDFGKEFDRQESAIIPDSQVSNIQRTRLLGVSTTAGGPRVSLPGGPTASMFDELDAGPSRAIIETGRTAGRTLGLAGAGTKAIAQDILESPAQIAGYKEPVRNLRSLGRIMNPANVIGGTEKMPGPTPFDVDTAKTTGLERFLRLAATGLAQMEPQLAVGYGLGAAGAPAAVSAGLPMVVTPEGQYDPIGAAIAAGLPGVTHAGEAAVAKLLGSAPVTQVVVEVLGRDPLKLKGKIVQKLGGIEFSNDTFRKFMEAGGGFMAANAYLLATGAPQLAALPPEQRGQAVLDYVAQSVAPSLLGFIRPGMSRTLQEKAPEIAPQLSEIVNELRQQQQKKRGPSATTPEQQQGGVPVKPKRTSPVGQTGQETGTGDSIPSPAGQPNVPGRTGAPEGSAKAGAPANAPGGAAEAPKAEPALVEFEKEFDKQETPGPTVPEKPETIEAQMQLLADGKRNVVMITPGEAGPKAPPGFGALSIPRVGTFIFNPSEIHPDDIRAAAKNNTLGDLLGYGIPAKPAPGTEIGAVVVRDPKGVEKQGVLTDAPNLPAVVDAATKVASPGDTIKIESEAEVIAKRTAEKKSSTQLTLPPNLAAPIISFAKSIPDAQVYHKADATGKEDYGIETEPHITALFGLTEHSHEPVANAIAGHGPIEVTLGKISVFENPDYDVLKVDVKSPSLRSLNSKLSKLPNKQTFEGYEPHLTIAYLKKGEGKKYVGDKRFDGQKLTFDTLTFSPPSEIRATLGRPELPLAENFGFVAGKYSPPVEFQITGKVESRHPHESYLESTTPEEIRTGTAKPIKATELRVLTPNGKVETVLAPGHLHHSITGKTLNIGLSQDILGRFWAKELAEVKPKTKDAKTEPATTGKAAKPGTKETTTAAAGEVSGETAPASQPQEAIARWVAGKIATGEPFKSDELYRISDAAYGKSQAEGGYTAKDAYDAMEMGVNLYIWRHPNQFDPKRDSGFAKETIGELKKLISDLPTQTKRDVEQDAMQQFSTPPALGYAVAWTANIGPGDTVLEPSAGIGGLAVFAKNAGANVVVNELSDRRAEILRQMGFEPVYRENAEQLNNILPAEVRPTVVIMNPPFSVSATLKGKKSTEFATAHLEQALARLQPGGRLVAIVGEGMGADRPTFKNWWKEIGFKYNVRANVHISGDEYRKYGTTFGNQIIVIDKPKAGELPYSQQAHGFTHSAKNQFKNVPEHLKTLTGEVQKIEELIPLLEKIRNEREPTTRGAEPTPIEPAGGEVTGGGETTARPEPIAPIPTGGVATEPAKPTGGEPEPAGAVVGEPPIKVPAATTRVPAGTKSGLTGGTGPAGERLPVGKEPAPSGGQPAPSVEPARTGESAVLGQDLSVEAAEEAKAKDMEVGAVFENYKPQVTIKGAKEHPTALSESAAMSSVPYPETKYKPSLPATILTTGALSGPQFEAVMLAGAAHGRELPDGRRRGFFIGDGTGVGKGRTNSAIILDNWNQGRKKAVWLTADGKLFFDAQRDIDGIGWNKDVLIRHGKIKLQTGTGAEKVDNPIPSGDGVLFSTYSLIRSEKRMKQLVDWLGKDFDGVIIMDESHKMANAVETKGARGKKKASEQALMGLQLQGAFPKARKVYVSATGATEVSNLAYAEALGLWGEGTPFPNRDAFISEIGSKGMGAMEIVAKDLKAMGMYVSRNLSFDGVTYERLEHQLTTKQREMYDTLAGAWQIVLQNMNAALGLTGADKNGQAKSAARSAFWGAHQRFFNQLLTSLQMPTLLSRTKASLEAGRSVVVQLVNTNEAQMERALSKAGEEEDTPDLETLDITPREALIQYIDNAFPVDQYEEYTDDNGTTRTRPVLDSQGNRVQNREAVALREALKDKLSSIRVPIGALDELIDTFGEKNVAEVTGRSRRVVTKETPEGRKKVVENRNQQSNIADRNAFNDRKKRVLAFSDAGGTGASYHADRNFKNQEVRDHIVAQPGWRADNAIQGLGRSHRSNQKQPPNFILISTDVPGHKRFVSTIARRIEQLGALTKGQRQTTSQGVFDARDNLESTYARESLRSFLRAMAGNQFDEIKPADFSAQTGLELYNKDGQFIGENIQIGQFLNRLLSLNLDMQDKVFRRFSTQMDGVIEWHKTNGTLDAGMETLTAKSTKLAKDQTLYTDPDTGAKTKLVALDQTHPTILTKWNPVWSDEKDVEFAVNKRSGVVWKLDPVRTRALSDGTKEEYRLGTNVKSTRAYMTTDQIESEDKFEMVKADQAEVLWKKAFDDAPKTFVSRVHLVTGTILPVWDRIPGVSRIARAQEDTGQRHLGVLMPADYVPELEKNFGLEGKIEMTPAQAVEAVIDNAAVLNLSNGWKISRRYVSGEDRIEIAGPDYSHQEELRRNGVIMERIGYQMRYFIPTGPLAESVMGKVIRYKPIVEVLRPRQGSLVTAPSAELSSEMPTYEARSVEELHALLPHIGLPAQSEALLRAFLESPLAKYLEGIRVRVADTLDGDWQGSYFQGLVEIARNADPIVGPHELLHPIWDVLPDDIKAELERMRKANLDLLIAEAQSAGSPDRENALTDLRDNPTSGGEEFLSRGYPVALTSQLYPYSSAEEFFTHSGSERFKQKVGSTVEGFWARVKQIISDFIAVIKRALKLRPNQQEFLDKILRGDFEPATAEEVVTKGRQGSLTPEEQKEEMDRLLNEAAEQHRIPTMVLGEPYYVQGREQLDPAAGHQLAKALLDASGLPSTESIVNKNGQDFPVWVMTPQGRDTTIEGEKLLKAYKERLNAGTPEKASHELAGIVNAIRLNFEMPATRSAMAEMEPWIRVELWAAAQSNASARGIALRALMGARDDIITVGRNIDAELGKIWSDALGGDAMRRVLDELEAAKAEIERLRKTQGGGAKETQEEVDRLKKALEDALKKHAPTMRKRWGPGTSIGKSIIELIKGGRGKPWDVLREMARAEGWKIPTDEQLQQAKRWADQLDEITKLTPDEAADKTAEQQVEMMRLKTAGLADEQMRLRKNIETFWARVAKPYTVRTRAGRENITSAIGDYISANLLAKAGFATRQFFDIVVTQMTTYTPTSAVAHTLMLHEQEVAAGKRQRSDVAAIWKDLSTSLGAAYKARTKALRGAFDAAGAVITGANQGRNVAALMQRVSIYDKAMQRADELDAKGEHGKAWLLKFFTLHKVGYVISQALDQFQGVPLVHQEMHQQVVRALRENGLSPAEAEAKADYVLGDPKLDTELSKAEAVLFLEGAGKEATKQAVQHAAWRIAQAKAYERMRALGLNADDFQNRNLDMLETNAWNEREEGGIGGAAAEIMRLGAKTARKISGAGIVGLPVGIGLTAMTRFGNAIGIMLNRKLTWAGLGFAPGWFGVDEREIGEDGIARGGSPFYRYPEQRKQRKVEASVGLLGQIAMYLLAATGIIVVRLAWPKDKEERQVWDRMGWKPGQVDIPVGNDSHIRLSMNVGPLAMFAPGLSAGAALRDLGDKEQKAQAKLNAEAERLGLEPGKIRPRNMGDYLAAAVNAAMRAITSGRTISGLLSAFSEQGSPHVAKSVSSLISSVSPYQPGLQEVLRMTNGTVLDTRTASVWDFFMPLPSSKAAQVNFLGDAVGSNNALQRMVETLTGGNNLLPANDKQRDGLAAYQSVFANGYRPPSIDPNRGYAINGQFRPMTDSELRNYTVSRGQYLKQELADLGPDATAKEAQGAYVRANQQALAEAGVDTPQRAGRGGGQAQAGPQQAATQAAGGGRGPNVHGGISGGGRAFSPRSPTVSSRRTLAPRRPRGSGSRRGPTLRVGRGLRLGSARAPRRSGGILR